MSEIGFFIKLATRKNRRDYTENLSLAWLANNLSEKGFKEVLGKIDGDLTKQQGPSPQEVRKNWRRLASFTREMK